MNKSDIANAITDYSHTVTSKLLAMTGGASAVSHTPAGGWIRETLGFLKDWPWMETLSYIAIILLIIERAFIVWAWNNKRKRGEM